ncbi:MAG: hypothetical protein ACFFER_13450 [Candidatus Thorarchaeota archaeon]
MTLAPSRRDTLNQIVTDILDSIVQITHPPWKQDFEHIAKAPEELGDDKIASRIRTILLVG